MIEQLTPAGLAGQGDNLPTETLLISLKNNFVSSKKKKKKIARLFFLKMRLIEVRTSMAPPGWLAGRPAGVGKAARFTQQI